MKLPHPAAFLLLAPALALAQAPAPAGPKDAIRNGGFERTLQAPNLWSGVDKDGFLAGFRGFMPALRESGTIAELPLPLSVAVKDIDNDGLLDIATADPLGYIRYYKNSGTKEAPKFTTGTPSTPYLGFTDGLPPEVLPGMPGNPDQIKRATLWARRRLGIRISLADLGPGKLGLLAGNYFGEIFMVPQSGPGNFPQPQAPEKALLDLSKSGDTRRWGNLFAPLLHDWDGDGKADLIVGEGSYSANNVHLLPNNASTAAPAFDLETRSALALGEGRQQTIPAVADINGDGKDDLLVADSRGRLTAYLRPADWKKGDTMKPSGYLAKAGGITQEESQALVLGSGIPTVATGDLNGDGLFDIVVGKASNARAAWAPNKGTKEQPKFEAPIDLPGDKPSPATWLLPSQWDVDVGETRGNFFAYVSSVSAQEDPAVDAKEGSKALKFGFVQAGSPLEKLAFPGSRAFEFGKYTQNGSFYELPLSYRLLGAPSRTFMIQQQVQMETGKDYKLSFQHRGGGVVKANAFLGWWGFKVLGENKVTRGARGATEVQYNHANEMDNITKDFRPGSSWATFSENLSVKFKNKDLKDQKTTHQAVLIIAFELTAPDGFLYLDDLKLVPAAG
ncbi:MAG: FG-GAP repeat domain-containing protein [Chthoniobacterales bacterium]